MILVEALGAIGCALVTGPLDPAAPAELLVAQARVVARPTAGALLPGFEAFLGRRPANERLPFAVAQVESMGEIEEDVHVRPRLARRIDGPFREMDGAVGVRERA